MFPDFIILFKFEKLVLPAMLKCPIKFYFRILIFYLNEKNICTKNAHIIFIFFNLNFPP